jgi:predicted alpha-1,6-mannanase (GH76 family)
MAENVTQTQPQQESKATDSLLDMVTKQVAKKLLLQGTQSLWELRTVHSKFLGAFISAV